MELRKITLRRGVGVLAAFAAGVIVSISISYLLLGKVLVAPAFVSNAVVIAMVSGLGKKTEKR